MRAGALTPPPDASVTYDDVAFSYPASGENALAGVSARVDDGEIAVVVGPSGSGKSSLLQATNGLVPHSSGGMFRGEVWLGERQITHSRPRELADVVGHVHQDPEAQFVVDRVEDDIAFVLENLGLDQTAMRRRVEEVLDALGVAHLRDRSPATLSGGERQRCAIAGALAAAPSRLVLDEPTSQLDPQGADDVLAALTRLNADLGVTLILAEHRLDRAAPLADRALVLDEGQLVLEGAPREVLAGRPEGPVVLRLGEALGWDPLPLTVREARPHARGTVLAEKVEPSRTDRPAPGEAILSLRGVTARVGGRDVLRGVSTEVRAGEVVVLMGRNGSGKTTLLRTVAGLAVPAAGEIDRQTGVGYVPQDPNLLLSAETVRDELATTLRLLGRRDSHGRVEQTLDRFELRGLADRHPRALSGGQRQRVAVAAVVVGSPGVLLLDEPTRGMDAAAMADLERALEEHVAKGGAAIVATHDVELAARIASRAIILGDGEVVADGPASRVLAGSLFAPQVTRLFPPLLTIDEVLARAPGARR